MASVCLDWIQKIAAIPGIGPVIGVVGTVIGVVLGVWLTRLGQRRQFRYQLLAQRAEAALLSYTEGYKIAVRMRGKVNLELGQTLREMWSTEQAQSLTALSEQLWEREFELRARDADTVADAFADVREAARTFLGFAVPANLRNDSRYPQIELLRVQTVQKLHELVEVCPGRWTAWGTQPAASTLAAEPQGLRGVKPSIGRSGCRGGSVVPGRTSAARARGRHVGRRPLLPTRSVSSALCMPEGRVCRHWSPRSGCLGRRCTGCSPREQLRRDRVLGFCGGY